MRVVTLLEGKDVVEVLCYWIILYVEKKEKEKVYAVRRVWEASDRPRRPFVAPWEQKDVEPHMYVE